MRRIIAMDGDGTVFNGPITQNFLSILLLTPGVHIIRIGNKLLETMYGFVGPHDANGEPISGLDYGKTKYLAEMVEKYGISSFEEWVVVDDNPAQYQGFPPPWVHKFPLDFIDESLKSGLCPKELYPRKA